MLMAKRTASAKIARQRTQAQALSSFGVGVSHRERRQIERAAAQATNVAREAALAFLEADANNDGQLEWDEFVNAIQRLRSKGLGEAPSAEDKYELRKLFNSIDSNGSGHIEMDEYFLFTLDVAAQQGCGLETIFQKYDTSGEGLLDANEFALAVEDLGFTATFAHDLFVELDDDNSGAVSYTELTKTLKDRVGNVAEETKKFLTTLAFHDAHTWSQSQQVDVNTGKGDVAVSTDQAADNGGAMSIERLANFHKGTLKGPDADSLRGQLQELLHQNSLRDSDLYNLLTMPLVRGEATRPLTRDVFTSGLKRLGYTGAPGMLLTLFKKIDTGMRPGNGSHDLHVVRTLCVPPPSMPRGRSIDGALALPPFCCLLTQRPPHASTCALSVGRQGRRHRFHGASRVDDGALAA